VRYPVSAAFGWAVFTLEITVLVGAAFLLLEWGILAWTVRRLS
jgi:hypothetical protein